MSSSARPYPGRPADPGPGVESMIGLFIKHGADQDHRGRRTANLVGWLRELQPGTGRIPGGSTMSRSHTAVPVGPETARRRPPVRQHRGLRELPVRLPPRLAYTSLTRRTSNPPTIPLSVVVEPGAGTLRSASTSDQSLFDPATRAIPGRPVGPAAQRDRHVPRTSRSATFHPRQPMPTGLLLGPALRQRHPGSAPWSTLFAKQVARRPPRR